MTGTLAGMRVWVTRPRGQADHLACLIEARGGHALIQPVLEIAPPADLDAARATLRRLDTFEVVVFASRNAVGGVRDLIGDLPCLASRRQVYAVGAGTAAELSRFGVDARRPAAPYGSESLLTLPGLAPDAIAGRRVLILKGEGGRELLARELARRGAQVESVAVYRRAPLPVPDVFRRTAGGCQALIATSVSTLAALLPEGADPGRNPLRAVAVVANSERVARAARERGFVRVVAAEEASDEGLLAALYRVLP